MSKKGFALIFPLIAIAVLVASSAIGISLNSEKSQKISVGRVLSDRDQEQKESTQPQSFGKVESESSLEIKPIEDDEDEVDDEDEDEDSNGTGSSAGQKMEFEKEGTKIKIKTKNEATGFESETEVEDGKEKTKVKFQNLKIEFEREGNKVIAKVKDENGEEVELEDDEKDELFQDLEDELSDDDITLATDSANPGFVQKGRRVRTNFPLSVNPVTGELFVTTPAGEKVVTILPSEAIENMIRAGIMTRTEEPPSPPPADEGTGSAQVISDDNSAIELAQVNDEPVYIISGIKAQNLLGVVPVDIKIKTYVSTTDGSLMDIEQNFFSKLLDLLSF